jgi:hypothetical protein
MRLDLGEEVNMRIALLAPFLVSAGDETDEDTQNQYWICRYIK